MLISYTKIENTPNLGFKVRVESDIIYIKLYSNERDSEEFVINLNYLKQKTDYSDYSCFVYPLVNEKIGEPFNRYADTFITKRNPIEEYNRHSLHSLFHVYVPYEGASWDECAIHFIVNPNFPLIINCAAEEKTIEEIKDLIFPKITLIQPSQVLVDGFVNINVVTNKYYPLTIYINSDVGYVAKRKFVIKENGNFKIYALGLEQGDEIKVKIGFKYFTNVVNCSVKVI